MVTRAAVFMTDEPILARPGEHCALAGDPAGNQHDVDIRPLQMQTGDDVPTCSDEGDLGAHRDTDFAGVEDPDLGDDGHLVLIGPDLPQHTRLIEWWGRVDHRWRNVSPLTRDADLHPEGADDDRD